MIKLCREQLLHIMCATLAGLLLPVFPALAQTSPEAPVAPVVAADSSRALTVAWVAPMSTGSSITDYDVQYRVGASGLFTEHEFTGTDTSTLILGLSVDTAYEVQVRATNADGEGEWSPSGMGSTSASNTPPRFTGTMRLTISRGGEFILTSNELGATDTDNTPAELSYILYGVPTHGELRLQLDGAMNVLEALIGLALPQRGVNSFTQADVDAGLVSYGHDDGSDIGDSFAFNLGDLVHDDVLPEAPAFTITIQQPPTAVATGPSTVDESEAPASPGTVVLDGTGSADPEGGALAYAWLQESGPSVMLTDADTATPMFEVPNLLASADVEFSLRVTDPQGLTGEAGVTISIVADNDLPTAEAGPDQDNVAEKTQTVTLDGSGSADPEGSDLTYAWTQESGRLAELIDPQSSTATFVAPNALPGDTLVFTLTVTEMGTMGEVGLSSTDMVTIRLDAINDPPIAEAGPDQMVHEESGRPVLDGSGSTDPEGSALTYAWVQESGRSVVLRDPRSSTTAFDPPESLSGEKLVFRLTVTEKGPMGEVGLSRIDMVTIRLTGLNDLAIADAGPDQDVIEGTMVILDGSGSADPEGESEFSYAWTQKSGSTVPLTGAGTVAPTFVAPSFPVADPVLVFELEVLELAQAPATYFSVGPEGVDEVSITVLEFLLVTIASTASVDEGGSATIAVTSTTPAPADGIVVTYMVTVEDGDTALAIDFSGTGGTVTIPMGETSADLSVATIEDNLFEGEETFTVTLTDIERANRLGTPSSSTVTITDAAADAITVSLMGPREVREGRMATYTVTLNGGIPTADVMVSYRLSGSTVLGIDYMTPGGHVVPRGTVTIAAGDSEGTISIMTTDDGSGDAGETLIVTLSTPTGGGGPAGSLTVDSTANIITTVFSETTSIFMGAAVRVEEGDTVTLPVTLTEAAPAGGIAVSYTISDSSNVGEAAAADYMDVTVTAGIISFAEGESTAELRIMVVDEPDPEGEEVFTVTLGTAAGDAIVSPTAGSARVTIGVSDPVTVSLAGDDAVREGDLATYTVTLGSPHTADVMVPYALSGTAESGTDYTPPSGTVTIAAAEREGTISVMTTDDGPGDANETLIVTLGMPTGEGVQAGSVIVDGTANTVTTVLGEVRSISMEAAVTVNEGMTVTLPVTLTEAAPAGGISVSYTISDSSKVGDAAAVEYTDVTVTVTAGSISFGEGESTAELRIMAVDDADLEEAEVFRVTLGAVTVGDAIVSPTARSTVVIILESDPIMVSLTGPAEVAEGDTATYTVTLTDEGPRTADVMVPYTLSGTAESGTDYETPSGSVTIPASATSGTIEIRTTDDGPGDANETLIVTLGTPAGGGVPAGLLVVARAANTVTTVIDDGRGILMEGPTATVEEGSIVRLGVTLTEAAPAGGISVSYTISDGSNPGEAAAADYTDVTAGILRFPPGGDRAVIRITAVDDSAPEGEEVFTVTLGAVTGDATVSSAVGSTMVTIGASDPITVSLTGPAEVAEGDPAMYTVTLSGGTSTAAVMVPYTLSGMADSGTDYETPSGSVTIPASATSGTIEIRTTNDGPGEADETLIVTLQTPTGGGGPAGSVMVDGTANAVTTTLSETIRISMAGPTATVEEGSTVMLEVTLTKVAPAGGISVSYTISDGSNPGRPQPLTTRMSLQAVSALVKERLLRT